MNTTNKINPVPYMLQTIGAIPTSYLISMTYEEQLLCLKHYLETEVVPKMNENIEGVNNLIIYINEYFENLNVQEEINNKLEEMVQDGTFDEIINQTLFTELNDKIDNTANDLVDLENSLQNKMLLHFPYLANINGDCYIFENGDKTFIVDLGRSTTTSNIVNYLVSKNLTKIDGVIITHYHGDHVGGGTSEGDITGFENFFNSESLDFSECEVYLPFTDNMGIYNNFVGSARYIPTIELNIKNFLDSKNISYHEVNTNETVEINDKTILTFYNADNTTFNNYYDITEIQDDVEVTVYNNFSTIFEIKVNDKYFLGTGDIEEKAEEVNISKLHVPSITKIEHHGNNNTTNIDYLEKIINSEYGIVLPTNTYYTNIYKPTTNAFNTTKKLIWLDELQDNIIIKIEDNSIDFVTKSKSTLLPIAYNNHIKSLNSPSVFPDFASANNIYESTDLNNLTTSGTYKSISAGVGTYLNVPLENVSFRLFVTSILDSEERLMQLFITNNDTSIFIRKLTNNGWTVWSPLAQYGMGSVIPNSSDLNNYVIAGKYYIGSANNSNTISNRPTGITSAPFVLEVEYMHDKRRLRQLLYNNVGEIFFRFMSGYNETTHVATFGTWYKITTTTVS